MRLRFMSRDSSGPIPPEPILAVYAVMVGPRTWRSLKVAVDTGATYAMLPPELLIDTGYNPANTVKHLELSTASGLVVAPMLRIHSESPVEGLLGLNFLRYFKPFQLFRQAVQPFTGQ